MAVKYVIDDETMTRIAEPLRSLAGRTDELTPAEMAAAGNAATSEVNTQTDLIARIGEALEGKAAGNGGIVPTGTKEITANGEYDVTTYAKAKVNVPSENLVETCTVTLDNESLGCDCPVVFLSATVFEDGAIKNFVVTLKESDVIHKVTIPNAVCGSTICLVSSFYTGYNEEPYVEITGSATFAAWEGIWPDRKSMRLDFIAPTVANEDCTIKYSYVP